LGLDGEEESEVPKTTYLEDTTMDLEEEYEATKLATLRSQMRSNNVNNTPREYGFAQYV
jgi:hypothetical protein